MTITFEDVTPEQAVSLAQYYTQITNEKTAVSMSDEDKVVLFENAEVGRLLLKE